MTVLEAPRVRLTSVDAVRGLAIALMVLDHLGYLFGWEVVRFSLGRLSMPLFFVLSGALVTRLTSRHALAAVLGLLVPLAAPWAGSPNVLLVFAVGAAVIALCEWAGLPVALLVLLSLVPAANRWEYGDTSYDPAALIALMALGRMVGLGWTVKLGEFLSPLRLEVIGRRPLLWYVGNVLLIQGVILWVSKPS